MCQPCVIFHLLTILRMYGNKKLNPLKSTVCVYKVKICASQRYNPWKSHSLFWPSFPYCCNTIEHHETSLLIFLSIYFGDFCKKMDCLQKAHSRADFFLSTFTCLTVTYGQFRSLSFCIFQDINQNLYLLKSLFNSLCRECR